jgi:hypothetical protein
LQSLRTRGHAALRADLPRKVRCALPWIASVRWQ